MIEHGQRVPCGGPVGERQALIPGAAVPARIPGDDAELGGQRVHLFGEHGAVHEEFVRQQNQRAVASGVLVVDVGIDRAGEWHEVEDSQPSVGASGDSPAVRAAVGAVVVEL